MKRGPGVINKLFYQNNVKTKCVTHKMGPETTASFAFPNIHHWIYEKNVFSRKCQYFAKFAI